MKKIAFIFIAIIIPSLVFADSIYRDELHVILPPKSLPPVDLVTPVIRNFEARYKVAGKPKIALFWNVELIDSLKDKHIKTERVSGNNTDTTNRMEKSTTGAESSAKLIDGEEKSSFNITKTETTDQISTNPKRTINLNERDLWKTETTFTSTMRKAGVRFIDRSAMLRTTALKESTENTRELETKALLGKADLLMEVLMTSDAEAPLGWGFKVSVRDLKSGEEKTSLYTPAHPINNSPVQTEYKATDKGFEKTTYSKQATVNDIGVALAVDVMNAMLPSMKNSK